MLSKNISDPVIWENFVKSVQEANFLTSWQWGQFHQSLGKKVFYRGYYNDSDLIGISLLVIENARRGKYTTIAGGPLLDWNNLDLISYWVKDIKQIAKENNCNFIRVRPQILNTSENRNLFFKNGFRLSPMHLTADLTLQLDLNKSLEQILGEMRKNTRYEIKKAEKLGIEIKFSNDSKNINDFYKQQLALALKHKFVPFSYDFLKKQFDQFSATDNVSLISSYLNGKLLATAFVIFYGKEAVYHYGISTEENNRLPGAYAAQWASIKEAKSRGMLRYNFWGIAPKEEPNHRFAGVSLFKRGFGGEEIEYLHAHDLPISFKYTLINWFEKIRAKKRKL